MAHANRDSKRAIQDQGIYQMPNEDSKTTARDREGPLIHSNGGRKKYQISMNNAKVRGWYVKLNPTQEREDGNPTMVTANQ